LKVKNEQQQNLDYFFTPENRVLCRLGDSEFDDGLCWNLDLLLPFQTSGGKQADQCRLAYFAKGDGEHGVARGRRSRAWPISSITPLRRPFFKGSKVPEFEELAFPARH